MIVFYFIFCFIEGTSQSSKNNRYRYTGIVCESEHETQNVKADLRFLCVLAK